MENPYIAKIEELNKEVKMVAQELQSKTEERDGMLEKVNSLRDNKTRLLRQITELNQQKNKEIDGYKNIVEARKKSMSNFEQGVKSEKALTASAKGKIIYLKLSIDKLQTACNNFEKMATQVADVRKRYLSSRDRLGKIEAKSKETIKKTDEKLAELATQESCLKEYHTQMEEADDKLRKFSAVVKENVEALNSLAEEKDLNLRFGLPPDEIVEIPFEGTYEINK